MSTNLCFFVKRARSWTLQSFDLRVLGSPNPGQSFGRGLSGPQATEVSRDPGGSWAATNLTVPSSNSFSGPPFCRRAPGFKPSLHFLMFVGFFAFSNLEEGTWISAVSRRTQLCKIPLGTKKFDVLFFERLENLEEGTRILVVSWRTAFCNKLAASARILFVKCIFGPFLFFVCF